MSEPNTSLPDCMMPDGAAPCRGYYDLYESWKALSSKLGSVQQDADAFFAECGRLKTERDEARSRLDSANGELVNARLDQQSAEARQDELASMLAATERQRDDARSRLDSGAKLLRECLECDATGNSVPNMAIEQWLGVVERQECKHEHSEPYVGSIRLCADCHKIFPPRSE